MILAMLLIFDVLNHWAISLALWLLTLTAVHVTFPVLITAPCCSFSKEFPEAHKVNHAAGRKNGNFNTSDTDGKTPLDLTWTVSPGPDGYSVLGHCLGHTSFRVPLHVDGMSFRCLLSFSSGQEQSKFVKEPFPPALPRAFPSYYPLPPVSC